jgi:hypothetical protein
MFFNPESGLGKIKVANLAGGGALFCATDVVCDLAALRPGLLVTFSLDDDPARTPGNRFLAREVQLHRPAPSRSDLIAFGVVEEARLSESAWRERVGNPVVKITRDFEERRGPVTPPLQQAGCCLRTDGTMLRFPAL